MAESVADALSARSAGPELEDTGDGSEPRSVSAGFGDGETRKKNNNHTTKVITTARIAAPADFATIGRGSPLEIISCGKPHELNGGFLDKSLV